MSPQPQVLLASRSPRRRELLQQIGVSYEVVDVLVDETHLPGESPVEHVRRLALAKATAGLVGVAPGSGPILGADTIVVKDGQVFGKPQGREEAADILARLSGGEHEVISAVALVAPDRSETALSRSRVRMREITPAEMRAYWESGEPADKAGGYAIQGLGAVFVQSLEGSYSGVMGLPLFETAQLLRAWGMGPLAQG